jgi:hypothetical protein
MNHLLIEGLFSPVEVAALRAYCERALQPGGVSDEVIPYFEGKGIDRRLIRIERMVEHLNIAT